MIEGDDELVIASKRGDEGAFGRLIERHRAPAHRVAYLITRSSVDADDALQEGIVKAWYALDRFDVEAPFRPWFVTIVANRARNRARAAGRRERLALRLGFTPDDPSPEQVAESKERAEALLEALDRLPENMRRAVALRHLEGLSEVEAAAALGVRPGTVKSRVSRGLERLRSQLGENS